MNADYRLFEFTSSKTLIIFTCSLNSTISTFPLEHMACQWSHAFWVINSEILTKKTFVTPYKNSNRKEAEKKENNKVNYKAFCIRYIHKKDKVPEYL